MSQVMFPWTQNRTWENDNYFTWYITIRKNVCCNLSENVINLLNNKSQVNLMKANGLC
jgi:hypothetical protein